MKLSFSFKRLTALALSAALLISATACKKAEVTPPPESSSSSSSSSVVDLPKFINPLPGLDLTAHAVPAPPSAELLAKIKEKQEVNSDVIGWLRVPGTQIDEEVLQGPGPKDGYDVRKLEEFYTRRNIHKQYYYYGSYFADYENVFGDRNEISKNTIIYGHSMTDDLEKDKDPNIAKFTETKRYNDPEFAAANPYIYYSTPEDEMVWKVFASLYTDIDLPYYYPNRTGTQFMDMIQKMYERSEVNFNVDVNANDKIVILSTCTYLFGDTEQEHKKYRYLVAARLVRPDEEITATNTVSVNKDVVRPAEMNTKIT